MKFRYHDIGECNTFFFGGGDYYLSLLKHMTKLIFVPHVCIFMGLFNFSVYVRTENTKRCSSFPMCNIQHLGIFSTYIYIDKTPIFL